MCYPGIKYQQLSNHYCLISVMVSQLETVGNEHPIIYLVTITFSHNCIFLFACLCKPSSTEIPNGSTYIVHCCHNSCLINFQTTPVLTYQ